MPEHDVFNPWDKRLFHDNPPEVVFFTFRDGSVSLKLDEKEIIFSSFDTYGKNGSVLIEKMAIELASFFQTEVTRTFEPSSDAILHS